MAKPNDKPPSDAEEIPGEVRELAPKPGVIVNVPRLKPKRLLN